MKLTIGIASYDSMKVETALCLATAVKTLTCEMVLTAQKGPYTHWNRKAIVESAISEGSTHLMFVDTDVTFPADGIPKLLALDKDIAGASYNTKDQSRVGGTPLATFKMADAEGNLLDVPGHAIPQEPFPCFAVATGFMLIRLEGLQRMNGTPLFYCEDGVGEDVWFCRKAQEAGLEVWCDPTIPVSHLGDFAY